MITNHSPHPRLRFLFVFLSLLTFLVFGIELAEQRTETLAYHAPDSEPIDLLPILAKDVYTEEDYSILLCQTGLGRPAVDDLRLEEDYTQRMLSFQQDFFAPVHYTCEAFLSVSSQEFLTTPDGNRTTGYELAPLKDGDILITKASHTLGFRNGHAGIVIDAEHGLTLEAVSPGNPSEIQSTDGWRSYPSLIILRLRENAAELSTQKDLSETGILSAPLSAFAPLDLSALPGSHRSSAAFLIPPASYAAWSARHYLNDIPYRLTAGLFGEKYSEPGALAGTHCAHLVWEAYRMAGFDLDSDGGRLVTAKDIANSPLLEIVQIFGVDPNAVWP